MRYRRATASEVVRLYKPRRTPWVEKADGPNWETVRCPLFGDVIARVDVKRNRVWLATYSDVEQPTGLST